MTGGVLDTFTTNLGDSNTTHPAWCAQSIDSDVDNVATLLRVTGLLPKELDIAPLLAATELRTAKADSLWLSEAFERDVLGLRGLLPPEPKSFETQAERVLSEYTQGIDEVAPGDHIVTHDHIRKWRLLQALQDRNETLFYRVLLDNIEEMSPIVYTPTVGWACQNFSTIYRRPRGMFLCWASLSRHAASAFSRPSTAGLRPGERIRFHAISASLA